MGLFYTRDKDGKLIRKSALKDKQGDKFEAGVELGMKLARMAVTGRNK